MSFVGNAFYIRLKNRSSRISDQFFHHLVNILKVLIFTIIVIIVVHLIVIGGAYFLLNIMKIGELSNVILKNNTALSSS
ncbi:hypothetical protein IO44_04520 [Gallibacterium anatis str. Avicor]|uniref:Uncharacterized protein n=1 Tax=Gallibacterium anatis 4895 TaxID=1396510 RepID=A0A0A2ZNC6_9PAST|nr:hypothetical protein IO44_04520 [Gallibacterium anatis str. Avicor]KGQ58573.1 hypothetical protein IO48_12595 [Gallibacterium anatis 4895]